MGRAFCRGQVSHKILRKSLFSPPTLQKHAQFIGGSRLAAFNLVIPVAWIITSAMLMMLVRSFVDDEDMVQYNLGLFVLNRKGNINIESGIISGGEGSGSRSGSRVGVGRESDEGETGILLGSDTLNSSANTTNNQENNSTTAYTNGFVDIVKEGVLDMISVFSNREGT